jgi:hypothetical protein
MNRGCFPLRCAAHGEDVTLQLSRHSFLFYIFVLKCFQLPACSTFSLVVPVYSGTTNTFHFLFFFFFVFFFVNGKCRRTSLDFWFHLVSTHWNKAQKRNHSFTNPFVQSSYDDVSSNRKEESTVALHGLDLLLPDGSSVSRFSSTRGTSRIGSSSRSGTGKTPIKYCLTVYMCVFSGLSRSVPLFDLSNTFE